MNENERTKQIELATQGDTGALQLLIVEYDGSLRALLEKRLDNSSRRYTSSNDILHDAYVAAYKGVSSCRFSGPAQFYRWLETIVIRKLMDHQRKMAKSPKGESHLRIGSPDGDKTYVNLSKIVESEDETPSQQLAHKDMTAAVLSSLARLPEDQRRVIQMRFLEHKPVAEVADALDKSEAAIHGLCQRGLKNLNKSLVSISRYLLRS